MAKVFVVNKEKSEAGKIAVQEFTLGDPDQFETGEVSDGYHTFNELYRYRMLYNAIAFEGLHFAAGMPVVKSKRHHTGEECFGGGWFIVMAQLPTGQVSNHYELKDWDLFRVPEVETAPEYDGHSPQEAANRIEQFLRGEYGDSENSEDKKS